MSRKIDKEDDKGEKMRRSRGKDEQEDKISTCRMTKVKR
jgi:hypothetical protein